MIDQEVANGVTALLGRTVTGIPARLGGFGNENWRVPTTQGELLVKIGKGLHDPGKIQSSSRARKAAADAGVPVPSEVRVQPDCQDFEGRLVRIFEFIPGDHPTSVLDSSASIQTFFSSLGRTVAKLHTVTFDAFSSRVGGQPAFPTWSEYVSYRVPQIMARARACDAFPDRELTAMFERVLQTADDVSPDVRAALSHRDLYLDNILVREDGTVRAILDFDICECWDPTVDLSKPRWQVFPQYENSEQAFLAGYHEVSPALPRFQERLWVTEMLELTNHAVNAIAGHNQAFADSALARLREIV